MPESSASVAPPDATPLFRLAERRVGRRAVLSVTGEVDVSTAEALRAAIETSAAGASEIWVDLTETTFMDSSGLHVLVCARADLAEADLRFALICPDGPVLRVLRLAALDRLFEIHASLSAANHAAA